MSGTDDLFLKVENTTEEQHQSLPLVLVVGREPNNSNPFNKEIGNYTLEALTYEKVKRKER